MSATRENTTTKVTGLTALNVRALVALAITVTMGKTFAVFAGTPGQALGDLRRALVDHPGHKRSANAVARKLLDASGGIGDTAYVTVEAVEPVVAPAPVHRHEPSYRHAMVTGTSDRHGGLKRTRGTCACGVEVMGFEHGKSRRTVFFPVAFEVDLAPEPLGPVVDESDDAQVAPISGDDRMHELVVTRAGEGHLVDERRPGHALCGVELGLAATVGIVPASSAGCLACVDAVPALPVEAPVAVGGGSQLVTDDAYGAGMLPLAGGDGFLF